MWIKRDRLNDEYRLRQREQMRQGKRKDQVEFSSKMAGWGIIGIVVLIVLLSLLGCGNGNRDITLDDYLDGTEETVLDTIRSIIPNGKGSIEYPDGTVDSIRYSDEHVMWIGADGDTIWE